MSNGQRQSKIWALIIIFGAIICALVIWQLKIHKPGLELQQPVNESTEQLPPEQLAPEQLPPEQLPPEQLLPEKQVDVEDSTTKIQNKKSLQDVLAQARGWGLEQNLAIWFGQQAPDFTVTDITGKTHKLSDYRGRNVIVVFWATWCLPCYVEIPHLIKLRNENDEDELAILAISNESERQVSDFAVRRKMNYTVISADVLAMPQPFSRVISIPSSFFIDAEGKIKIVTSGLIPLKDIKAILQTNWKINRKMQ